jgi:hypothetical protein
MLSRYTRQVCVCALLQLLQLLQLYIWDITHTHVYVGSVAALLQLCCSCCSSIDGTFLTHTYM